MRILTIVAAAWTAAWGASGWHDAAAGAWMGIGAIAAAPAVILLASALRRRPANVAPAADAEAQAWHESGWGGGLPIPARPATARPARPTGWRAGPRPAAASG